MKPSVSWATTNYNLVNKEASECESKVKFIVFIKEEFMVVLLSRIASSF